ncbi:MAG: glycosyltransferase family 2 protein [Deltaproteobacteria bacterium]|uniref:Glycosyltransferase family 2 protein n=1 Tax=Candidatus Zymogenus saltonus TaxID=2844893 RepID=A0A9D8KE34_9DELT|nr:glycosyltransferase family 2 protein [Candidatus Zymogenus saltonus]
MRKKKKICVVIPAHNEERLITDVLDGLPAFVDWAVVVDDNSDDDTVGRIKGYRGRFRGKVRLASLPANLGVGGAIARGYREALEVGADVAVVMAGDNQMDPADLPAIVDPVIDGEADYTKGNRLFMGGSWEKIPKVRYLGNSTLSLLTKVASGYWHVVDSQSGYTAINRKILELIDIDDIYPRYGMPNDMLIKLNVVNARVKDVKVRPVYDIGERSEIRLFKIIPSILWLLTRGFFSRMAKKYVIYDFHPLVFFYLLGLTLTPFGSLFGLYLIVIRVLGLMGFVDYGVAPTSALFAAFLFISGLQSLFFAMWFDMEYNKSLK